MRMTPLRVIAAIIVLAWIAVMVPSRWYMPDQRAVEIGDIGEAVADKEAVAKESNIQVGKWYASDCNPFGHLRVRVIEIKDGWVKYEHTDGSGRPKKIGDFIRGFCKTPYLGQQ